MTDQAAKQGPFGLWMGMKVEDFTTPLARAEGQFYFSDQVPKPHPEFVKFAFRISPKLGLANIVAMGAPIDCNPGGSQLRDALDQMRERLDARYGSSGFVDSLDDGALWGQPFEWMRSLVEGERSYFAYWDRDHGSLLPRDVESIFLMASADSESSGNLRLRYTFFNYSQVEAERIAEEDSVL
jgi:hypothetical protein